MKKLLFTVFALITIGAMAQEKANHNTSRSNKTAGGIAKDINTDTGESEAGIFERRKCVKAGGTFYEFSNGTTRCLPARVSVKSQNLPTEEAKGGTSDRKKCLKAGNVWITSSKGSMCLERLESSAGKL